MSSPRAPSPNAPGAQLTAVRIPQSDHPAETQSSFSYVTPRQILRAVNPTVLSATTDDAIPQSSLRGEAASTMAHDLTPRIVTGLRLHTATILRFCISSSGIKPFRPEQTVRTTWPSYSVVLSVPGASPTAIVDTKSFSASGCCTHFRMWPTRRSMSDGESGFSTGAAFCGFGAFS